MCEFRTLFNSPRSSTWGLTSEKGLATPLMCVHVNNFLLHCSMCQHAQASLTIFMDTARAALSPEELVPPTQTPKYTGFIFDTTGIPTLCIPSDKQEWGLAMVDYMLSCGCQEQVSTLGLAVVVGTLESLSDATPSHIGHTNKLSTTLFRTKDRRPSAIDWQMGKTQIKHTILACIILNPYLLA